MGRPTFAHVSSAILLGLLLLPAARMPFVDVAAYDKDFARRENRAPAKLDLRPGAGGLRGSLRAVESWFSDRYGFRTELIRLRTRLYLAAGQSPREDLVVLGKDGWLYLGNGHGRVIDKTTGRLRFTEAELEAYLANLESMRELVAARGARLMVVVAPEKHTVYPEHLPVWARNVDEETLTRQVSRRLGGGVLFTDLTEALRAAKASSPRPLYFKADTHWNSRGAYVAYRSIMGVVGRHFPEARALEEPRYREAIVPMGDLPPMIAIPAEPDAVSTPVLDAGFSPLWLDGDCTPAAAKEAAAPAAKARPARRRRQGGGPMMAEWRDRGNYLAIAPNGCKAGQAAVVTGSGLQRAPRVLVVGDSFTRWLSPYLNQSFGSIVYVNNAGVTRAGKLRPYLERYEPDLVLLELVERNIQPR
ncbi:MAG TPA: hypothetical protein VI078_07235 [bacterium]